MINEDKIREVWASDPERGFKLLIDFFQQPIYWHIRRLVVSHEDAEDILQEVFIRVFRHLPQFREESSLGTWIYRIATNECLRFLNMRKEQAVSAEEVQEELMNKLMASVSHEDAEDILQEVFIRVFRHLPQFREESSLGTWIYRIATNECLRFLNMRKEQAVSAEEVQEELMNKLMASDYVDYENEMAVKFQQAILMLPEKQRVVFNLRYYDELEYEEISRITDTKVDTLKVNYHYAKEKIKEYMINN